MLFPLLFCCFNAYYRYKIWIYITLSYKHGLTLISILIHIFHYKTLF